MHFISIFLHHAQIPVMWGCLPHRLAPLHLCMVEGYCHSRIWCKLMYPTPSTRYTWPIGHLANGMELSNITLVRKARVKLEWLPHLCPISGHHVKLILIKGILTILSITVLYYKQITTILSMAVYIFLHSPPFFLQWACPHAQAVKWLQFSCCQIWLLWLSSFLVLWGY